MSVFAIVMCSLAGIIAFLNCIFISLLFTEPELCPQWATILAGFMIFILVFLLIAIGVSF